MLHLTTSVSIPICTYICVPQGISAEGNNDPLAAEAGGNFDHTRYLTKLLGCMGLYEVSVVLGYTLRLGAGFLLLWLVVELGFGNV